MDLSSTLNDIESAMHQIEQDPQNSVYTIDTIRKSTVRLSEFLLSEEQINIQQQVQQRVQHLLLPREQPVENLQETQQQSKEQIVDQLQEQLLLEIEQEKVILEKTQQIDYEILKLQQDSQQTTEEYLNQQEQ